MSNTMQLTSLSQAHQDTINATAKEAGLAVTQLSEDGSSMKAPSSIRAASKRKIRTKAKPLAGDRFLKACHRSPLIVKAFLLVALSGLPFFIFLGLAYSKFSNKVIDTLNEDQVSTGTILNGSYINATLVNGTVINGTLSEGSFLNGTQIVRPVNITYKQLSEWLSISWGSFIVIFCLAQGFGKLSKFLCGLTARSVKYAPLAETMWLRLTLMAWVGATFQACCIVWKISEQPNIPGNWTYTLRQAFMFLLIAFSIILVQGIALQLIAIQYIQGYVGPRAERASDELQTLQSLNNLIKPHIGAAPNPSFIHKMAHRIFYPQQYNIFDELRKGHSDDETVRTYAATIWTTIAGTKDVLHLTDFTARLRSMGRNPDQAEELFALLDESCDGDVTRDELEKLVVETAKMLQKRAAAMRGIQQLLLKLEMLLTIFVFGTIVFIYTIFFPQNWAKDVKSLWTGIVALSFAFAAPVAEVVNSCVFVFAKHAYDVGDYVNAKGLKLVVKQIYLTHTNFEQVEGPEQRGKVVQMSHASLSAEVITNWTRSVDVLEEEKAEEAGEKASA